MVKKVQSGAYVDEADWIAYFGAGVPVPDGFVRLENLSVELAKTLSPNGFPSPADILNLDAPCDNNINFGILEQMKFYDDNVNQLDGLDSSISSVKIGAYSENLNNPNNQIGKGAPTSIKNQLSPNAYKYWLNCNLFYAGIPRRTNRGCF